MEQEKSGMHRVALAAVISLWMWGNWHGVPVAAKDLAQPKVVASVASKPAKPAKKHKKKLTSSSVVYRCGVNCTHRHKTPTEKCPGVP